MVMQVRVGWFVDQMERSDYDRVCMWIVDVRTCQHQDLRWPSVRKGFVIRLPDVPRWRAALNRSVTTS